MTSRCTNERGFTLVEMIIAMFIFGIGMLGIMSMQVTSIQSNARADTMMVAASVASLALEETLARADTDPIFAGSEGDLPSIPVAGVGPMTIHRKIIVAGAVARVEIVVTDMNNRVVRTCGFKRL